MYIQQFFNKNSYFWNKTIGFQQFQEMNANSGNIETQELQNKQQICNLRNLEKTINLLRKNVIDNLGQMSQIVNQWIKQFDISVNEVNSLDDNQKKVEQQKIEQCLIKLLQDLKNVVIINGYKKCLSEIQKCVTYQREFQINHKLNQALVQSYQMSPIKYQMVNKVKQVGYCNALAFNSQGNEMVAGYGSQIRVCQFQNQNLGVYAQLSSNKGKQITCLVFSKIYQWFFSGDSGGNIQSWKEDTQWISSSLNQIHKDKVNCIILNNNENNLISSSNDQNIIVWNIYYQKNEMQYAYTLEMKHNDSIYGISFNSSNSLLISCSGDKKLILWKKDQKWIYNNHLVVENSLVRVSFVNENQIIAQQWGNGYTNVFEIDNGDLKENLQLRIDLNFDYGLDSTEFPLIYNQQKRVIIIKSYQYVYIVRQQRTGLFQIQGNPIDCENFENFGTLSEDGQYLVIWNDGTKEFRIFQLIYG